MNEKDLNLELVYIYTGSKEYDVGKEIFKRLNNVAAKQGDSASACLHLSLMCSRLLQSKSLKICMTVYKEQSVLWLQNVALPLMTHVPSEARSPDPHT